jgi:lipopolysaccharide export system protein LptA
MLVMLALALSALAPVAQEKVEITADRFVVEEGANLATFTGNVVVVQGTTTVNADKVEVRYGAGGASDIETLLAEGNLVIVTPTQHVTGQRGIYDPKTRVMVVSGDVVAESPTGRVTGSELRVDFEANTTEFATQDGGRVTGVFNP